MTTYDIEPDSTLVVSVDGGPWRTIIFAAENMAVPAEATPEEVADVINRVDRVSAIVRDDHVEVTGELAAANASIEVDLSRSTAVGALGLHRGSERAQGTGLEAPRLVSLEREPFPLPHDARMIVVRSGKRHQVDFTRDFTEGAATADEVAAVLNAELGDLAEPTTDGRVQLMVREVGPDQSIEVLAPDDPKLPDAAVAIGFTGPARISHPHATGSARLTLVARTPIVRAVSLSSGPIELHSPAGVTLLGAREEIPLTPLEAADPQLQRLVDEGAIRLVGATDG